MASIEKRADGWRVRWRDPDGRPRSRQCPTARSARDLKLEVEEACARGRRWTPAEAVRAAYLADLIKAYLADLLRTRAQRTHDRAFYALDPFNEWVRSRTRLPRPTVDVLTRSLLEAHDAHLVARGSSYATRRTSLWAIAGCWRWGWHHPDWRSALAEPSAPRMPRAVRSAPRAASWEQLDAIVHLAEMDARRSSRRDWAHALTMLMRGLGWRVSQCLALDWTDYDAERGEMHLRGELGKSPSEKAGRVVILPRWLCQWLDARPRPHARIVGRVIDYATATMVIGGYWRASAAPPEVYVQRPDHAFRIGLITGLKVARVDPEAVEYYVGHAAQGMRGVYVDPRSLGLDEVAAAIPPVGPRVRDVSEDAIDVVTSVGKDGRILRLRR